MDTRRLVLFIALSMIILLLWQAWEQERRPAPTPTATTPGAEQPDIPSAPSAPATSPQAPAASLGSGQRITVTTDLLQAVIDTQGGDLRELKLLKHAAEPDGKAPYPLLTDQGALFVAQSGLIGTGGDFPNHKTPYQAERNEYVLADGDDAVTVRLRWSEAGLDVVKSLVFHRNSYTVDVRYDIANTGSAPRDAYAYAQLVRAYQAPSGYNFIPTYTGGVIYTPDKKYQKIDFEDMAAQRLQREATGGWVAMSQHYFVGALIPEAQGAVQFYTDTQSGNRYVIGYKSLQPVPIAAGGSAGITGRLYAGPKEQDRLEQVAPGLELTIDYGWLTVIAAPLFWVLDWLHGLVRNWGWAIVILTVLIKLAFYPLSAASYKSMAQMRKLTPRLQTIRERYGDDRARMNQAVMELYKTEKINPLGGCLPIVIQIPVFIALYWVLLESVELRHADWVLWIKDLSNPDPFYVLPLIMGATMFAQMALNPAPVDPIQKKIMMAMPVAFTVFFLFFPAGLVLYWVVNNVLSIAQQWWITRQIEAAGKT